MSCIGNLASELLQLEAPKKSNDENKKLRYTIVYWIETKMFNVTPFFRIPRDKR